MNWLLLLGPPTGNEVKIILWLVAIFASVWILAAVYRRLRRRFVRGAQMHETVKECRALVMRSLPQLMALSELETSARPDPSKWSKKEILGHLIDSASNNHQRFVRAQLSGEVKLPSYEQDAWVKTQGYQAESWEDLVQLWRLYNLHLLHVLETMPAEKLTSTCFIGEDPPVTIESLAREYQLHLKHHLDQILSYPTASPPTAR